MCISTVNQEIRAVRHVSWLQGRRRAGKGRGHCPLPFQKGDNRGGGVFFIAVSWIISWFIKVDLKYIYCHYSRTQKILNGFL